jgi:hypothetical protein
VACAERAKRKERVLLSWDHGRVQTNKLNPRGGEAGESPRYAHDEGDGSTSRCILLRHDHSDGNERGVGHGKFLFCVSARNRWWLAVREARLLS